MYDIFLWIIIIVGGGMGVLSSIYIVASLFGVLGQKIYRKIRYGTSMFD